MDEIKADDNIEIGHNDNDDSLNLTIGEEEEHFLNEENDKKGKKCDMSCHPYMN